MSPAIEKPDFSIVTVTFNNRKGLEKTGASIELQDRSLYEWIVIDGGSNDGTVDFLKSSGLMPLYKSEPDDGIFDAMNKGLGLAQGRYSIFMNAGDCFASADVLSEVARSVAHQNPTIIYGDSLEFDGHRMRYKPARSVKSNKYVMFTHHQSIFYRTDFAQSQHYDLSYLLSCDWVLTIAALKLDSFLRLDMPISVFERGGISQQRLSRSIYDAELLRIYLEESQLNYLTAYLFWYLKRFSNWFRSEFPSIYDKLRYRGQLDDQ